MNKPHLPRRTYLPLMSWLLIGWLLATTYLSHAQPSPRLLWYVPQSAERAPADDSTGIITYTTWADLAQQVARRPAQPYYLRLRLNQPTEADWQTLQTLPSPHRLHVTTTDTVVAAPLLDVMATWPALRRLELNAEVLPSSYTMVVNARGEATIVTGKAPKFCRLPKQGWERLPHIEAVKIEAGFEPSRALETLQYLPNLTTLELHMFFFEDTKLLVPLGRLAKLRELTLTGRDLRGDYVAGIKTLVNLEKLTLSTGFMAELNQTLRHLPKLRALNLTYAPNRRPGASTKGMQLADLRLGTLPNLDTLVLEGAFAEAAPVAADSTFAGLTSLRSLTMKRIALASLPASLTANASLAVLHVPKCRLATLPETLDRLTALSDLLLDENPLGNVPGPLCRLPRLRHLSLNSCDLDSLPAAIGNLATLTELSLASNRLSTLPASVGALQNLQSLNVGSNGLSILPAEVGTLPHLETLAAFSNDLTALPAGFPALKHLHLANNSFTAWAATPGTLRRLRTLTLDGNSLTALPEAIGQLDSLEFLSVMDNGLTALPEGIGLLRRLKHLSLDANRIGQLPERIGTLGTLRHVSLNGNPLESLPNSVGNWLNVRTVRLQLPRLRNLPETIGAWQQLRSLTLESDVLLVLPGALTQCRRLTNLHVSGARLIGLPESIGDLRKLKTLTVLGRLDSLTQEGLGAVVALPASLSTCTALDELTVQHQRQFDGSELLQLATRLPHLARLAMVNCGLTELGYVDWKSLSVRWLDVSRLNRTFLSADALRKAMAQ
jgi:erbb2-interacting protein